MSDAELIELIGYALCIAVLVEEAVGNDEGSLFAHNVFQLIKRNGQTALLEINLLGGSEPKHILSPLDYCFDVKQVLYANVLGNGVSAP